MRIVAHRGASALAPENTFAAFDQALVLAGQGVRVDAIETDIQLTRDGVPVCLHDATLDRTTTGRGPLEQTTWDDVRGLDAGGWFSPIFSGERVPSLDSFLDRYAGRVDLCVELKDAAAVDAVVRALDERGLTRDGRIELSSFDLATVQALRTRLPGLPLLLLGEHDAQQLLTTAAAMRVRRIGLPARQVSEPLLRATRSAGIAVRVWEVADRAAVQRLAKLGVDAVTLDDPRWGAAG